MLDALVNRSNTIVQRQRIYQADTRPVYQRLPRSGMYMKVYMAFFTVGMIGITGGLINASKVSNCGMMEPEEMLGGSLSGGKEAESPARDGRALWARRHDDEQKEALLLS
ncbi:hypothetical protein BCV69DRAFT_284741 [Microstroma glucosiphilum]|uniref:Uncharacterized protein n=1 Tax=Pseudomicrostroma glucosiphilum TaxID=1684307 RepID=A0A316U082_9BASI|nr:hypothetical protein BCV69DRAFT_284741 [Pseudomicrostroma glucosiphilum]PWN18757.1 hypothetical protein BCV69DRAFT_284741 [Pseudomicrostroma glucosiphilum]